MRVPALLTAVEDYGIDAVDIEIVQWIQDGLFDWTVMERAETLGHRVSELPPVDYFQDFHRAFHKDGPYGFEFCGRCDNILRKFK